VLFHIHSWKELAPEHDLERIVPELGHMPQGQNDHVFLEQDDASAGEVQVLVPNEVVAVALAVVMAQKCGLVDNDTLAEED